MTLEAGTERAFTGKTVNGYGHDSKATGTYVSAIGGLPLFTSDTKVGEGRPVAAEPEYDSRMCCIATLTASAILASNSFSLRLLLACTSGEGAVQQRARYRFERWQVPHLQALPCGLLMMQIDM